MRKNTQFTVENRRNWKGEVFDYDAIQAYEPHECQYCLTDAQIAVLGGLIETLGWSTRWQSDTQLIDEEWVRDFKSDIARRLMVGCCGSDDTLYRFNGTVLEQSDDGGITWYPSPSDYRKTSVQWPDPNDLGIETTKCASADGIVQTFKQQMVEAVADDDTISAIAAVIIAALLFVLSAGTFALLLAQLGAVVAAIFRAGVAVWKALFTTEVWDDLRCLVYCAMTTDSSIDQTAFDALYAQVGTHYSGLVAQTLQGYLNAAGAIGLTNMMRSGLGSPTADCSDCDCDDGCDTEWSVYIGTGDYFGEILSQDGNTIHCRTTNINTNGVWYIYLITDDPDQCCYINSMEVISGTPALIASDCGNAIGTGLGNKTEGCFNQLQPQATGPFEVIFHIAQCP
jgi:hypothetical protein